MRSSADPRRRTVMLALLAVLACAGIALLLIRPPSPARAAPTAAAQTSSSSCASGTAGELFFSEGGPKLLSETDLKACVTGRLTVSFAGDQSTGCAARGLCGYAGTESYEPQGMGELSVATYARRGGHYRTATLILGGDPGGPVVAAVQRSPANAACRDRHGSGGFISLPVKGNRITIGLPHAKTSLLGTRCAGPVGADMAAALPSQTVSVSRLLHGSHTIDLRGSRRFDAHGFAGTVTSTLMLALTDPRRSSNSGGSPPPTSPPGRERRVANVRYRVVHVGGSAVATVRSSALAAVCSPFDACGLQETIHAAPGPTSDGSAFFGASAPVTRPKRDLLAALGLSRDGDPSGINVAGAGIAVVHGTVSAVATQQHDMCRDQVGLHDFVVVLYRHADRLVASLSPAVSQADDPLRTRCLSPNLARPRFTTASIPLSVLRHPTFTVSFHGSAFSNGPYRVTTRSSLSITLQRLKVTTQSSRSASELTLTQSRGRRQTGRSGSRCAHGTAASSCADSANSTSSRPGWPISCTAKGRPSSPW